MAKRNTLNIGESRVGLMIDGLPETPRISVKLERTEHRVEVTVPFLGGHSDPYQHWFSSGIHYDDDPQRTKRRYEPPRTVSFYDAHGSVGLVGSRPVGSMLSFGGEVMGEGRLAFDYAVLGAATATFYSSINGLRSEVEGLGTWVGMRSLGEEHEVDDAGRLSSVSLRLEASPPIRVTRRLNAEFQPNWRYAPGPGPDQTTISERMQLQTQVRVPQQWDNHFKVHFALRNLLRIAAWRQLNFASHEVMSLADPLRTMDGTSHGDQWLPVVTHRTGITTEDPQKLSWLDFLFSYPDVAAKGVGRWISLSQELDRGLAPLVGLLELKGASLEAHLAQVGIGFETLGYDLLRAGGVSKTQADREPWAGRIRAVTSVTASVLPFDEDRFVELLRRNYSAVKHADNARPDVDEMYLAYRQAIQVFRAWVAIRLGMPKSKLKVALDRDAVTSHIRQIERAMAGSGH